MRSATVGDRGRTAPSQPVHLIDANLGPLVGAGHVRRVAPFAITATISMLVAVPATSWERPRLAIAGSLGVAAVIAASFFAPWQRLSRKAQLGPPVVFVAAILSMLSATENGNRSPFLTMAVLPMMWLAIYESRVAVFSVATLSGVALVFMVPGGTVDPSSRATASFIVFVICAAGMGVTLNDLVAGERRLARALREESAALASAAVMLDALPEQLSRYHLADHTISYYNAAWGAQHHVGPAEAVGLPLDVFLSDDELVGLTRQLDRLGPSTPILDDEVERADGTSDRWFQWIDCYIANGDGAEILSIGRDVTDRHHAEAELAASEARYRALADKSADVVWHFVLEPTPHFDYMSPSVENILGYPPSYFVDNFSGMLDILDDEGRTAIQRALNGDRALALFDFRFRHADGSIVIGETHTTLVHGGLQGVSRDVTELRRLQANVTALAFRDPLTGLANRRLFDELLDADLARTERNETPLESPSSISTASRASTTHTDTTPATSCSARRPAGCSASSAAPTPWHAWVGTSSCSCTSPTSRTRSTSSSASTERCPSRSTSPPPPRRVARPASGSRSPATLGTTAPRCSPRPTPQCTK